MRRPNRALVIAVGVPFLAGCFMVLPAPVPPPAERSSADIRGVIRENGEVGERIEFSTVEDVSWTATSVSIVGTLSDAGEGSSGDEILTRTFPLTSLSAVLTRRLDVDRTSFLVGGVSLAAIVSVAFFVFNERTGGAGTTGPG